jgi:hypothetical protein
MKKLMFTAIALVAFSGISMADNTIVEKEIEQKEVLNAKPCETVAYIMASLYEESIENEYGTCLNSSQYNAIYNAAYKDCMNK